MTATMCLYLTGIGEPGLRQTCIEALADGWIQPADFCPFCTGQFMAALDRIAGPMVWHSNFTARAGQKVDTGATDATFMNPGPTTPTAP